MVQTLEKYLNFLDSLEDIDEENKKAIKWFLTECLAEGICEARRCKYVYGFHTILRKFAPEGFKLNRATEKQLKIIVGSIHESDYSDATKCHFKQCLKKFYKLKAGGAYPKKVRFIKTTQKKTTSVRKEDLYTPDEIRKIMNELRNIRDRAYVITQYESAARTGEMLNATLADVTLDQSGEYIRLHGLKGTPDRVNQLIEAGYYLKEWIRSHPAGGDPYSVKDPSAPLWVKLEQYDCKNCKKNLIGHNKSNCQNYVPHRCQPMTLDNIHRNFQRACIRAGIRKRTYRLYNLRHSRITEVAKFLSNQQVIKFAGWKPGSGQFHVYVHLDSEDVNEALRQQYKLDQTRENITITCSVCGQENQSDSSECLKCRRPINLRKLKENSDLENTIEALQLIAKLSQQGKLEETLRLGLDLQNRNRHNQSLI